MENIRVFTFSSFNVDAMSVHLNSEIWTFSVDHSRRKFEHHAAAHLLAQAVTVKSSRWRDEHTYWFQKVNVVNCCEDRVGVSKERHRSNPRQLERLTPSEI